MSKSKTKAQPASNTSPQVQEALRGLGWALVLSLGILGVMVALLTGFGLLGAQAVTPRLQSVLRVIFPVAVGVAVGSFWTLAWLKRQWAAKPVAAKPDKPAKSASPKAATSGKAQSSRKSKRKR